jgi:hypothetical protein
MGLDYAGTRSHNLLFHIFVDEYIDHHHQCPDQTVHKAAPPTITSMALLHHPSHAMVIGAISVPLLLAGPTGPTGNATVAFGFVPATTVGCTGVVGHSNLTQVLLCLFYVYFMFISIHNFSVLFLTILIVAILLLLNISSFPWPKRKRVTGAAT